MVQFKEYFLQQKHLDSRYIGTTTVQKCVRTNDIDIIGTDGRHLSFFEMLGNFSFGKYFKKEMCAWAWEFSTQVLQFEPERIYVTVYTDDDEAYDIWKEVGVEESHISRLGAEDNFWVAGPTGPCGPCSELYYDQGKDIGCGSPDCKPGCDCDRFLEYWNLVFTQFNQQEDGSRVPLEKKNIDTGMGLERVAAIMQGVQSNFDTDVLRSLIGVGEKLSGKQYGKSGCVDCACTGGADGAEGANGAESANGEHPSGEGARSAFAGNEGGEHPSSADAASGEAVAAKAEAERIDLAMRVIADHARSVVFMVGDGILPSNEGRGYVLRRLIRRAVREGRILGIEKPFLNAYLAAIIDIMGSVYPEIIENRALIEEVLLSEEKRFRATIDKGERFLEEELDKLPANTALSGTAAFTLHDTYGFPFELTAEICRERNIEVDEAGFQKEMEAQRQRARNARDTHAWDEAGNIYTQLLETVGKTEFVGYAKDECEARVLALVSDNKLVESANTGDKVNVVLDCTPFYGEMGGQVGDTGIINAEGLELQVLDTKKPQSDLVVHICEVKEGNITKDMQVKASIDVERRAKIARNHTATHILQRALSQVLGDHVKQAGSRVSPEGLRFDFTHFEQMHHPEILEVERICNKVVMSALPVLAYETSLSTARENGVLALFGEKYGEFVRVVEAGNFSKELCGGTHVGNTAEISLFKITNETSIGANTRRIEAVTSLAAYEYMSQMEEELRETARFLKVAPLDVSERTEKMANQLNTFEKQAKRAKRMAAEGDIAKLFEGAVDTGAYKVLVVNLDRVLKVQVMRETWDIVKQRAQGEPAALVCFAINDEKEKPMMLAAGNDGAVAAGFNANDIIKEIAPIFGGGGGGKPNMAQAGGSDATQFPKAIDATKKFLGIQLDIWLEKFCSCKTFSGYSGKAL